MKNYEFRDEVVNLPANKAEAVIDVLFNENAKPTNEIVTFKNLLDAPLSHGWIYVMTEATPGFHLDKAPPKYTMPVYF